MLDMETEVPYGDPPIVHLPSPGPVEAALGIQVAGDRGDLAPNEQVLIVLPWRAKGRVVKGA